jgi:hypothetical protein
MQTARVLEKRTNWLYPLMVIAAVTVIVFSIMGIATMMGWLPSAQSKNDPAPRTEAVVRSEGAPAPARADAADTVNAPTIAAPVCANCGVIEY